MSTKANPTESISESIVESEMVAQQSQHPKPIKAEDIEGPSKLQIPLNPKWIPSSEIKQDNVVMTISNKV